MFCIQTAMLFYIFRVHIFSEFFTRGDTLAYHTNSTKETFYQLQAKWRTVYFPRTNKKIMVITVLNYKITIVSEFQSRWVYADSSNIQQMRYFHFIRVWNKGYLEFFISN